MKKQTFLYLKVLLLLFTPLTNCNPERYYKDTYPTYPEEAREIARTSVDQALSGGAKPEDKQVVELIQKRALSEGYTTYNPISVIFHGRNKYGKTTLAENLLKSIGNKGVLLTMGSTDQLFQEFVDTEIKKPIQENESYTFIFDEYDEFGDTATKEEIDHFISCINEAKRRNIESNKQRYLFIGTTNFLNKVLPGLRGLSVNINISYPNFAARFITLQENIAYETAGNKSVYLSHKNFAEAARKTEGFSYCCLQSLARRAYGKAAWEARQGKNPHDIPEGELINTPLTRSHLMGAIEEERPVALDNLKINLSRKKQLHDWLRYDVKLFLCKDMPHFGRCLIAKIMACSGIKKFSGLSGYWPLSMYFKKKSF